MSVSVWCQRYAMTSTLFMADEISVHRRVALIIPCIPQHVPVLKDLLRSVAQSTVHPEHVVVSLSQTLPTEGERLQTELQRLVPMSVLTVSSVSHRAWAAENRNRGARATDASIYSFMDADDLMMPRRLEVVLDAMVRHNADVVLHALREGAELELELDPEAFAKVERRDRRERQRDGHLHLHKSIPNLHHGHITVDRAAYWKVGGQNESAELRRAEDSHFVRILAKNDYRIAFVPQKLSEYRQHLSSERLDQS